MAMFYPRKQTFMIFIICAIAVLVVIYYAPTNKNRVSNSLSTKNSATNIKVSSNETLPNNEDWRKQFMNASTSKINVTNTLDNGAKKIVELTDTDIFGRNFFTTYMELRNSGLTKNEKVITTATQNLIEESLADEERPRVYRNDDIKIIQATDINTLIQYGTTFYDVINTYGSDQYNNEAEIAGQALESQDMSLLKKLDPLIANYNKAISILTTMPVPKSVTTYHLELLNGFSIALSNATAFKSLDKDPMKSVVAVQRLIEPFHQIDIASKGLKQYLISYNINVI